MVADSAVETHQRVGQRLFLDDLVRRQLPGILQALACPRGAGSNDVQSSMFQVRAPRILSFEGSVTKAKKDPSLRSGRALNFELGPLDAVTCE